MRIVKIVISIVALMTAAIGGGQLAGVVTWNPALVDLISAGGGFIGTFGIVPFKLPPMAARACAGGAAFVAAATAAHASGAIPGAPKLFNAIAVVGTLVGLIGRWQPPVTLIERIKDKAA